MEANIISFKVFVNSKGNVMSEYSKLPVEKLGTVFDGEDIPLIKKISLIFCSSRYGFFDCIVKRYYSQFKKY